MMAARGNEAAQPLMTENVLGTAMPISSDRFFDGEPGLIQAFDFAYDEIIAFEKEFKWAQFVFVPCAWISACCCYPCFLNQNIEWNTRAQHLALTQDGIRYVTERHPSSCGLSCSDVGKKSQTVPYDKITDCDVNEPAGTACCCCVQNVLSTVQVDTASSGKVTEDGAAQHELTLSGLKFPNEFKQAVWSMKRNYAGILNSLGQSAPVQENMSATAVLIEIREELRKLNASVGASGLKQVGCLG